MCLFLCQLIQLSDHVGNGAVIAGSCHAVAQCLHPFIAVCCQEGQIGFVQHGAVVGGITGAEYAEAVMNNL